MKKLISIFLILSLLASGINIVWAEEEVTEPLPVLSTEYKNSSLLLKTIGIADIEEEIAAGNIARKDFVKSLYKLVIGSDYAADYESESYFYDVYDPAYVPYINGMKDMGIVNGFSDGSFGPDNSITAFEAITLMLRALGYDLKAEASGGYPYGYLEQAKRTGIIKTETINNRTLLTNELMVLFFKRALNVNLLERKSINDDSSISIGESNVTLLEAVWNTGYTKGIVDGIDATKLYGDNDVPPWHIRINGVTYDVGELNPEKLLGYNVEAYYRLEDEVLICIFEDKNKNETTTIDIADVVSIVGNTVTTEVDGKYYKYSYPLSASVIFNMAATRKSFDMNLLKDKNGNLMNGTITFINNNSSAGYEVIKIMAGRNIVAGNIDKISYVVEDMTTKERISLETGIDEPYVEIYSAEGLRIDFLEIKKGNTITFYKTADDAPQTMIKAYVSTDIKSGRVESIDEDSSMRITVKGETYTVASDIMYLLRGNITAGSGYTFYINADGYISGYKKGVTGDSRWGMIIDAAYETKADISKVTMRIFSDDKQVNDYVFADSIRMDGVMYTEKPLQVLSYLEASSKVDLQNRASGAKYNQMILFNTNSDGEINYIDTVMHSAGVPATKDNLDGDNSLYVITGYESTAFNVGSPGYYSVFEEGAYLGNSTPVFVRPMLYEGREEFIDKANYFITTRQSAVVDRHEYTYSAYYTSADSVMADMFARGGSGGTSGISKTSKIAVIDKVTKALTKEGFPAYKLTSYYKGEVTTAYMDPTVKYHTSEGYKYGNDLKRGDLIQYATDKDGIINQFRLLYSAKTDTKYYNLNYNTNKDSNTPYSSARLFYGYVIKKFNDGIEYVYELNSAPGTYSQPYREYTGAAPIVYYNRTKDKVEEGSLANIKPATLDENGVLHTEGASKILIHLYTVNVYGIIVIDE